MYLVTIQTKQGQVFDRFYVAQSQLGECLSKVSNKDNLVIVECLTSWTYPDDNETINKI